MRCKSHIRVWAITLVVIGMLVGSGCSIRNSNRPPVIAPAPTNKALNTIPTSPSPMPLLNSIILTKSVSANGMELISISSISPGKKWSAIGHADLSSTGNTYTHMLQVLSRDQSIKWTILEGTSALGLGYTIPAPLAWSSDEKYLFVTNRPVPDGCSYLTNGSDLQRLDLESGQLITITSSIGNALSISPDGSTLAYVGYEDRGLVIRRLNSNEEQSIRLPDLNPDSEIGSIVFSPDNSQIAVTVLSGFCGPSDNRIVMLWTIDVQTLKITHAMKQNDKYLVTVGWLDSKQIILNDDAGHRWNWQLDSQIIRPE